MLAAFLLFVQGIEPALSPSLTEATDLMNYDACVAINDRVVPHSAAKCIAQKYQGIECTPVINAGKDASSCRLWQRCRKMSDWSDGVQDGTCNVTVVFLRRDGDWVLAEPYEAN